MVSKVLRMSTWIHIVFAPILLLLQYLYLKLIPTSMNGFIEKSLFEIDYSVSYGVNQIVFNSMLIYLIVVFVYTVLLLVLAYRNKDEIESIHLEQSVLNVVLLVLLVVSNIVFFALIPSQANGDIIKSLVFVRFEYISNVVVTAWNFSYLLFLGYFGYNIYVMTQLPKVAKKPPVQKKAKEFEY